VFEIGNSLREARLRQGLDLAEIEQATKIRSRYLRALEEEQFELLPAQTYVKGFLKAYADQLGLDGDLYVEEFNSRFAAEEEPAQHPGRGGGGSWPGPMRFLSSAVLMALTAIGLATVLVVAAWRFGATDEPDDIPGLPPAAEQSTKQTTRTQRAQQRSKAVAARRPVRLVASAVNGRCWLEIHRGSETGELLYEGTLERGRSIPLTAKRFWIAVGAPANVVIKVNGNRVSIPRGSTVPREIVVDRRGATPART
jgi:transcriptional regulator with XRE-family HTH domain